MWRRLAVWPVRYMADRASVLFARLSNGFAAVAAGTMTVDELRLGVAHMCAEYQTNAADIAAGFDHCERAVLPYVRPTDRVLVVGAGSGRELLALAKYGCAVTGVEPLASVRAVAERALTEAGHQVTIFDGYIEDLPIPGMWDVWWFTSNVYSYIPGRRRREAVLSRARAQLAPGGRVIIRYGISDPVANRRQTRILRAAGRLSASGWDAADGDSIERRNHRRPTYLYEHLFTPDELEAEARASGLRRIGEVEGAMIFAE